MNTGPAAPVKSFDKALALALAACAAVFVIDIITPAGVTDGVFYIGAVALCLFSNQSRKTVLIAALATVLVVIGYFLSPEGGAVVWMAVVNRVDSALGIWLVAGMVLYHQKTRQSLHLEHEGTARVETALRTSTHDLEEMRYALDQSAIVARTDARGIINHVNDKFCQISKYSRQELLGKDHRIINSGYHPKEFMRNLWQTILSGNIWRGEIRNRAKDGTFYWVDTTIVPLLGADGKPEQFLAIRSDITARKAAEERVREQAALAKLGEMAAVVAHEVKNPLAGISGAIQIISSRFPEGAPEKSVMGEILSRITSLNGAIEDLLLYARPKPPRFVPVNVSGLLQETVTLLKKDPKLGGIDVEAHTVDCTLEGDAEQLKAVFLNLLINASQALDGKGKVRLSNEVFEETCRVRIRDDGPGIPREVRDKVFEPFFTTKSRGTGLGLPLVKRVVEAHRGNISLDCPDGGGTVVDIVLPTRRA